MNAVEHPTKKMKRENARKKAEDAFAKYLSGKINREAMIAAMDAYEATKPTYRR